MAALADESELNGVNNFFNVARQVGLFVPLMALVDYRGFRLIGSSQLPITKETLLYGSRDGGVTIKSCDPQVAAKVQQVAAELNIGSHRVIPLSVIMQHARQFHLNKVDVRTLLQNPPAHLVTQHAIEMHGPVDMEVHRGLDGHYYVLDLARLFPCQPQQPGYGFVVPSLCLSVSISLSLCLTLTYSQRSQTTTQAP